MSKFTDEWGSFTATPNLFIELSRNLSDHARWLFVLLRFRTHSDRECAWPSYDQLRNLTGWGRSKISAAIQELEIHGWLERRKRFGASVEYVLKRPSSPEIGLVDGEGVKDSSPKITVVPEQDYSSPRTGLQSSGNGTTASYHDQDLVNKTKGEKTERGADAPHAGKKSASNSPASTEKKPVAEKSSKGVKAKKGKSPRPPAIEFIRELTERYPRKTQWARIVKVLGEDFDRERLRECWEIWDGRGFRATNYDWLFDWYVNGKIREGGNNVKFATRKSGGENLRDTAEWIFDQRG